MKLWRAGAVIGVLGAILVAAVVAVMVLSRGPAGETPRASGAGEGLATAPAEPQERRAVGAFSAFEASDRLRVATIDGARVLADGRGRPVFLRGVSVNALVDYGRSGLAPVPLTTTDLQQMSALGLNVIRLAVSWSRLMPRPGDVDMRYRRRIETFIREAGQRRIYTVISMHADRYAADLGSGTEFDGAPRWAVATGGKPCGDPRPRYHTPCSAEATRRFYAGARVAGRSLRSWYASAVVALSYTGRAGGFGYAGIDLLNEPTDPDASDEAVPTAAWQARLASLQDALVRRVRVSGDRAPLWIQPQGPRSTAVKRAPALPAIADDQLVYAPHAYVDVYGTQPSEATRGRLRAQYDAFAREAATIDAPTVVGEFPGAAGGVWDELRREHLLRQRAAGIGGISWLWKQPEAGYGWGVLTADGALRTDTDAAQTLAEPRILAGSRDVDLIRQPDGRLRVEVKDGPEQLVDVWVGLRLDPPAGATTPIRVMDATGVVGHASRPSAATLGRREARGSVVRLRLARGSSAATLVPAG